jgi:hypothetical protein
LWQIPVRRKIAKAKLEQTIATVSQRAVEHRGRKPKPTTSPADPADGRRTIVANARIVANSIQDRRAASENGAASQLDLNLARAASMDVRRS